MLKTFAYPRGGRYQERHSQESTLCSGRNGISYCTSVAITDLGNRLVVRPITTRGPKANTFIEIPTDPGLLRDLAFYLNDVALRLDTPGATASEGFEHLYRHAARSRQVDGELEVDDHASVSIGSDLGAYVQAWMWVPVTELGCFNCHPSDGFQQQTDTSDALRAFGDVT